MLNDAVFVCTLTKKIYDINGDFFGVDKGALFLAKNNIEMEVAIGDFDSIEEFEFNLIKRYAKKIIKLNKNKDVSDSQAAIDIAVKMKYKNGVIIGGTGKRFDHTYVNLINLYREDINLSMIDDNNLIYTLNEGKHKIDKNSYSYISIFAENKAEVSISNVLYPLKNYEIKKDNLIGLSNEIIEDHAELTIHKGKVLIILSND
ncbi:MAG: thiamine diphosphokinase [Anaerorhabdus sp.]